MNPGKATVDEIRTEVEHYHVAYQEIMNLSNDIVNFPIFRVEAATLKRNLAQQAQKIKDSILKATKDWCIKIVNQIIARYEYINKRIVEDPKDERDLVEIRKFIKDTPKEVEELQAKVKLVYEHLVLLEDYCYKYDEEDGPAINLQTYWSTKTWPLETSASITEGNQLIQNREIQFMNKLDQDKEKFQANIKTYRQNLDQIKTFSDLR